MINRCDLMLQDLKHFKTIIMSSYKSVKSKVSKVFKVPFRHVLLTISKTSVNQSINWWTFYMQNVHQMQTKLMNILHGECSSVKMLCNPKDAIASKNAGFFIKLFIEKALFLLYLLCHAFFNHMILGLCQAQGPGQSRVQYQPWSKIRSSQV